VEGFPKPLARTTNCNALAYSRYGYGNSAPLRELRTVSYMHDEALAALPELPDELAIDRPILLGHSDGASMALIHAGKARRPVGASS
jgi:pimeloyl-ACP methyl ester carboxylesterase